MTGAPSAPTAETPAERTTVDAADTAADDHPSDTDAPDADVALAAIRDRAAEIRDREVETALAKLDARGDLSAAEREAVERLTDRLVARLLSAPERGLRPAVGDGDERDPESIETALKLFGK